MHRRRNDDLFQDSTMTFGEHLEELRVCLFKAIIGLVVGVIAGLAVGWWVVDLIQKPMRNALNDYYHKQATSSDHVEQQVKKLVEDGAVAADDTEKIKQLKEVIAQKGLTFEKTYVPKRVLGQWKDGKIGDAAPTGGAAAQDHSAGGDLVPVLMGREAEQTHKMKSLNAQEPFMIYVKASLLVGAVLASPWVFYQIWSFVAAGLYSHEKRYVHLFLPISLGLFLLGAGTASFLVFEPVLKFLFSFNSSLGIDPDPRINEWLGFVLMLPLGFGISFQLPLVMLFLERIGVFTVKSYLSSWRIAILAIFILAMILTPSGDPYSMLLMACPLTVLYFGGIALCRLLPKPRSRLQGL